MPVRDILLTLIVGVGLALIFKHPAVAAYLWAWLSVMTPQTMTWSFARGFPFAQTVALAMFALLLFTKKKHKLPLNAITGLWLALLAWMTVTSFFAIAPEERVIDRWIFVYKIQVMMILSLFLVRTGQELRLLVVVVTLSLAYFGVKGGWFTLRTGGGGRVWGPGNSMLGGNNELAVGLVMILPFLYWMRQTIEHPRWGRWIRRAMTLAIVLCCFSILGSQSRGAFVAILTITLFLGLKTQYPVRVTLGIVTLVGGTLFVTLLDDSPGIDGSLDLEAQGAGSFLLRGDTALVKAAKFCRVNVARRLLAVGAQPSVANDEGQLALDYARRSNFHSGCDELVPLLAPRSSP